MWPWSDWQMKKKQTSCFKQIWYIYIISCAFTNLFMTYICTHSALLHMNRPVNRYTQKKIAICGSKQFNGTLQLVVTRIRFFWLSIRICFWLSARRRLLGLCFLLSGAKALWAFYWRIAHQFFETSRAWCAKCSVYYIFFKIPNHNVAKLLKSVGKTIFLVDIYWKLAV